MLSAYPTPAENINLPRIKILKKICKRVGYSGHMVGISDALGSLEYEPVYIEKHFTIDKNCQVEIINYQFYLMK